MHFKLFRPVSPHADRQPVKNSLGSPRTQKKTIETIRKIMKVALPTFSIIAATYVFLSHLPIVAMTISATAITAALVISYYWIVKPLFATAFSPTSVPFSPLEPPPFPPRSGSQSAPPPKDK